VVNNEPVVALCQGCGKVVAELASASLKKIQPALPGGLWMP
jgi:hypothetical protein